MQKRFTEKQLRDLESAFDAMDLPKSGKIIAKVSMIMLPFADPKALKDEDICEDALNKIRNTIKIE